MCCLLFKTWKKKEISMEKITASQLKKLSSAEMRKIITDIQKKSVSETHLISDILCLAFEHMHALSVEIRKLDFTEANIAEKSKEDKDRAQMLSHVLTVINDIIHPGHQIALEMFPEATTFIEYCINNQKSALEKKLISPECKCKTCKPKATIGK